MDARNGKLRPLFAQQLAKPVSGPENADTGPSLPFGEP